MFLFSSAGVDSRGCLDEKNGSMGKSDHLEPELYDWIFWDVWIEQMDDSVWMFELVLHMLRDANTGFFLHPFIS